MNTTLSFSTMNIRKSRLEESDLPDLLGHKIQLQNDIRFNLGEYDEIYEGYGRLSSGYPYRMQNIYTRELEEKKEKVAVLENDHLKATFLIDLGGRLWSLIDKHTGRNLLYTNDIIRFSNLSVRNAWFSGGVEWNCGIIGHTPYTASPMFVSTLEDEDGTPIIRMYETERVRGVTYQMDFILRKDSKALLCRIRLMNESSVVTPMYWWSNIAIPESEGGQIVVPADHAYSYQQDEKLEGYVAKVHIPNVNGVDIVHYGNIPKQVDYFFDEDESERKFLCGIDSEGYGLMHVSTSRLRSRKMFSWGNNKGSENWQDFLTDKAGRYIEVQAGIGKTQYGCIPMAPHTSWEWIESYSPVTLDPDLDWNGIRLEAEHKVESFLEENDLEKILKDTRALAHEKGTLIQEGSKETQLHNYMRTFKDRPLKNHLEFPMEEDSFKKWKDLVDEGIAPYQDVDEVPDVYFSEDEVFDALRELKEQNWYTLYHLSLGYYFRSRFDKAERYALLSIEKEDSIWARHALAAALLKMGRKDEASETILKAISLGGNRNLSFMKEASRILLDTSCYSEYADIYENMLNDGYRKDDRIHYNYIIALYKLEEYEKAKQLLDENGGFVPSDIREGNDELEKVYRDILDHLGMKDSKVPDNLKFRSL